MKYRLIESGGRLYRIQAVIDFGDVKKGDMGGYIEFEKNGAPQQTSSKCIPIVRFQSLWDSFFQGNINVDNILIGCRKDTDDGQQIDKAATKYGGPEISWAQQLTGMKVTLIAITAITCFMV